jgi:hypothetical protein
MSILRTTLPRDKEGFCGKARASQECSGCQMSILRTTLRRNKEGFCGKARASQECSGCQMSIMCKNVAGSPAFEHFAPGGFVGSE